MWGLFTRKSRCLTYIFITLKKDSFRRRKKVWIWSRFRIQVGQQEIVAVRIYLLFVYEQSVRRQRMDESQTRITSESRESIYASIFRLHFNFYMERVWIFTLLHFDWIGNATGFMQREYYYHGLTHTCISLCAITYVYNVGFFIHITGVAPSDWVLTLNCCHWATVLHTGSNKTFATLIYRWNYEYMKRTFRIFLD